MIDQISIECRRNADPTTDLCKNKTAYPLHYVGSLEQDNGWHDLYVDLDTSMGGGTGKLTGWCPYLHVITPSNHRWMEALYYSSESFGSDKQTIFRLAKEYILKNWWLFFVRENLVTVGNKTVVRKPFAKFVT